MDRIVAWGMVFVMTAGSAVAGPAEDRAELASLLQEMKALQAALDKLAAQSGTNTPTSPTPPPAPAGGKCPEGYTPVEGRPGVCARINNGVVQDYWFLPGAKFEVPTPLPARPSHPEPAPDNHGNGGGLPHRPIATPKPPDDHPAAPQSADFHSGLQKCLACHRGKESLSASLKDEGSLTRHLSSIGEETLTTMLGRMRDATAAEKAAIRKFVDDARGKTSPGEPTACKDNPINEVAAAIKGAASIDKLIGNLPEDYRRYSLVAFRSASRQPASADAPRVILFGKDAKLVMGFTATSGLEVTAFNGCTGKQEFYEVTEGQGGLKLSGENPGGQCSRCHGSGNNQHLNWLGYPDWVGFAGAQDDAETIGNQNEKHMASFAQRYKNLERYRHLVGLDRRFAPHGNQFGSVSNIPENRGQLAHRVGTLNRHFGVLAMEQNNKRIARMLYDQKDVYAKNKYLLASILADCIPRPAGGTGDAPATSPLFERIAQSDPRVKDLFSSIPASQNYIYERVKLANQKLGLGLNDLDAWKTSHAALAKTDSGNEHHDRYPFDDSNVGRYGNGGRLEPSTLYFVSHNLGAWDPEFRDLDKYRCNGLQLFLNDGSNGAVTARDFCKDGHRATCQFIAEKWSGSLGAR